MNSLIDQLFSLFGGFGLILIPVLALIVWGLAHLSAQPGTSVSILWGLVNYVKASSSQIQKSKNTEVQPAPEKLPSITHRDQDIYEAGRNLVPISAEKENAEDTAETEICLSIDWLDGAGERLAQFTEAQKLKKLKEVFSGKTILVEGVVGDVRQLHASIDAGDFLVTVSSYDIEPDQKEELESLHRGDAVRLRARPFDIDKVGDQHIVVCGVPFDIERTVT